MCKSPNVIPVELADSSDIDRRFRYRDHKIEIKVGRVRTPTRVSDCDDHGYVETV